MIQAQLLNSFFMISTHRILHRFLRFVNCFYMFFVLIHIFFQFIFVFAVQFLETLHCMGKGMHHEKRHFGTQMALKNERHLQGIFVDIFFLHLHNIAAFSLFLRLIQQHIRL